MSRAGYRTEVEGSVVFGIVNGTVGRWCWFDGVWVVG